MDTPQNSCEESGVDDLMYLLESSDGWESDTWDEIVTLPNGYELDTDVPANPEKYLRLHFLTQTYENGKCKYEMVFEQGWVVKRICPCGLKTCKIHLIDGDFVQERKLRKWKNICKFPEGHEMFGFVREGFELETLKKRYKREYKISCYGATYEVQQVCPCGKLFCALHIFPANIELDYSFASLAVYKRATRSQGESETLIEPLFRKKHPMTFEEVKLFFEQFKLNWEVTITLWKITFRMLCKCGKALEHTPCEPCAMKTLRGCHICGELRRVRMLKKCDSSKNCKKCKGICSDCKAAEISKCEHCKKVCRLDHECVPLQNQYVCFRKNFTYPPLIHSQGQRMGVCPDCKEACAYSAYPRHTKRRHNDKKPCALYQRDYVPMFCPYCDYYHFEKTNLTGHMNFHNKTKTYSCKLGCGKGFKHAAQEILHRQKVHGVKPPTMNQLRRVGSKMVRSKRQKTSGPAP